MSTEELLKPRYKVIADYPNNSFGVGTIITPDKEIWVEANYRLCTEEVSNYPHLFKRLEWWEDRKPEEMPQYVKSHLGVFKVLWSNRDGNVFASDADDKNDPWTKMNDKIQPATEQEYLTHLKTKA